MTIAAAGVLVMAWVMPYAEAEDAGGVVTMSRKHKQQTANEPMVVTIPAAGDPVWGTPLRRPLVDPPKAETMTAVKTTAPPLTVKLTGTVIEQGRSLAMFITAVGKVELKGVGEIINGAKVTEITDAGVRLEHNGRAVMMALPKKEGA
jgi:hypothetical protein